MLRNTLRLGGKILKSKTPSMLLMHESKLLNPLPSFHTNTHASVSKLLSSNQSKLIPLIPTKQLHKTYVIEKAERLLRSELLLPDDEWNSFSPEMKKEISDTFFNFNSNLFQGVDPVEAYEFLWCLVMGGHLDFRKYAELSAESRSALLNLFRSSWFNWGGVWALEQKFFTVEDFLSFPKYQQDKLINILQRNVDDTYTLNHKINEIKSMIHHQSESDPSLIHSSENELLQQKKMCKNT